MVWAQSFRQPKKKGARRCIVGIGGSATNDGGFGMARALGWMFLDKQGAEIHKWVELQNLSQIKPPASRHVFEDVLVAVDVRNPLIGPKGASRIYGPQKGLKPSDFAFADDCLNNLARVWAKQFGRDLKREPGAGAAGGLGFGLMAFLGANLKPGFELVAQHSELNEFLRSSDLVITGEGAIDQSTLMGKGVGQLASACLKWKRPCIALAGTVIRSKPVRKMFYQARSLTDIADEAYAKLHAGKVLTKLARLMAEDLTIALFTSELDHA